MREVADRWAMSSSAEKMAIVLLINRRGFKTIFLERTGAAGKTSGYLESNLTARCFLDSQILLGKMCLYIEPLGVTLLFSPMAYIARMQQNNPSNYSLTKQ